MGNHSGVLHGYGGRQYMSLLLYHNDEQQALAYEQKHQIESGFNRKLETEKTPCSTFYTAEDYHQKYNLKRWKHAFTMLSSFYPSHQELNISTLAVRLSGFVQGFGTITDIKAEIESSNLGEEKKREMIDLIKQIKW